MTPTECGCAKKQPSGESWGFAGRLSVVAGKGWPARDGAAGLRVVYSSDFFSAGAAWVDVAEECSPEVVLW